MDDTPQTATPAPQKPSEKPATAAPEAPKDTPDPTRFGDWEKNGRCIDF
ncbi:MAG: hypothetical protein DI582_04825 [Azospirillum brasilense]|nr:MAG: hypothetical protein DI582_04825 [Azospirillum brasilense]